MAFDLKKSLVSLAPTLATMLGGPFAGTAITALEGALGLTPGAGEAGITQVMSSATLTSEQVAAVRAADQKHEEVMKQQNIDVLKINTDYASAVIQADTASQASARSMQIAKPSPWPGILSAVTTLAVLGVIGARMYGTTLPNDPTTVQLIGSLTTGWGLSLSYWFGTTRSSGNKDALLAQSTPATVQ